MNHIECVSVLYEYGQPGVNFIIKMVKAVSCATTKPNNLLHW